MNEITYHTTDCFEENVVYTACFGIEPDGEVVLYGVFDEADKNVDASEELSTKIIEYITTNNGEINNAD
jgi:hypothetical protein